MYLKRAIDKTLVEWKSSIDRRPLLLRGARQVGKSESIKHFGKSKYDSFVEVNFEERPELKKAFDTLIPDEIIKKISLALNKKIEPKSTLIFFDEIQECPNAILALRYFFERSPEYHVIGAGSLLEFVLDEDALSIPVGRVQYIYMFPLSFKEFLTANKEDVSIDAVQEMSIETPISELGHDRLLKIFRDYLIVGGMPAAVKRSLLQDSFSYIEDLHSSLLATYRDDFKKYKTRMDTEVIEEVFSNSFRLVAENYKYSNLNLEFQSRALKRSLDLLEKAMIFRRVRATAASGLPLDAQTKKHPFKVTALDVGLLQHKLGLSKEIIHDQSFVAINRGAVAEQVVGQELIAYRSPYREPELFFWDRSGRASAEIDYLTSSGSVIIPIEVKAGATGRLKSLRIFLDEKKLPFGIRVSQHNLSYVDQVLSIPFYAISEIDRLAKTILVNQSL